MTTQSFAAAPKKRGRHQAVFPLNTKPADTVADFVHAAFAIPITPPPPAPRKRTPGRKAGIWDTLTPEERSAHGKRLASLRRGENMTRTKRRTGTPHGWNHEAVTVAKTTARMEAEALVAKLKAQGRIAPGDTEGEAATLEALTIVRSPGGRTEKVKAAKALLRHYHGDVAALV